MGADIQSIPSRLSLPFHLLQAVMNSLWHGLVDTIRLLPTVPLSKPLTDEERALQLRQTSDEKANLDQALEKLSQLIALRKGAQADGPATSSSSSAAATATTTTAIPVPTVSVSTPGSNGLGPPLSASASSGNLKRKRRLSNTASPAPASLPNSATESTLTSMASPHPPSAMARGATPASRDQGQRQRKDHADVLALQPGRKVAFKVPPKGKADGASDDEWILAVVVGVVDPVKGHYTVQDADDSSSSFDTSLRNLIPLPDGSLPTHNPSHPSNLEDFPKGSTVLGLYPETTSFYRATVIAAPYPGTGMGHGVRGNRGKIDPGAVEGRYLLTFVDDGGQVHEVQSEFVVLYPN
ncbi:SGF29 tudor-like domain-domain-containing protein [Kockovaella imperatae]|uniref:SGF29 tudor-like domain-domain-containing protein n=1 Tax=Kockovaella imperatae TaxID=4999 RepID=A0A1Y1UI41_9TREE|nr:SGF29 tudor-like domain-domain-containing protein [Kockovaella imperatae]ORX37156.1 SGF29 tudor-like domain-domain-containing protein [Kockovaella imperatae]